MHRVCIWKRLQLVTIVSSIEGSNLELHTTELLTCAYITFKKVKISFEFSYLKKKKDAIGKLLEPINEFGCRIQN